MCGYMVLPTAQLYAAFMAQITSTMTVFWATEAAAETHVARLIVQAIAPS
jgi:hypothetical protein